MASPPPPTKLLKHKSWSPDSDREEAWLRRKGLHRDRRRQGGRPLARSVTDEDLDELRGCIDLGFGFELDSLSESSESTARLVDTLPALDLYRSVRSAESSPLSIYSPGESPQHVKTRLRQWAQVVACSVRQRHP